MAKVTGARFVADLLRGYGVTHVFFVPQMLLETLTGMEGMGIRRVMVHGEKAAVYMADGYARACGRPGICMAQHVGASNMAAGLRDAYLACSPVIAITGGPAPAARYRHAYQELEDFTQFEHTTKLNAHVDHINRLPDMLRQAFREATTGAPGPVHLQIGGHHAESVLMEADLTLRVEEEFRQVPPYRPAADASHVSAALDLLARAERPIIVAGGGVAWSKAQAELVALADLKGDLHAHTKATDGRNTLREMALSAQAHGLSYLAITEHSRRLTMAHGLDPQRLAKQIGEIDALNASLSGITLLKGIEVDILEDGALDLPDSILAALDLVVVAVHSRFDLPRARQTEIGRAHV